MRYFAYGSNLFRAQLIKRAPSARFVTTASLPGWRLTFAGWSRGWGGAVATLVRDEKAKTLGAVYDIMDPVDVRALDAYEGCPVVYQCRRVTPIREEGCRRLRCWTYVMHPREPGYPSDTYAKTIATGLRDHGLSTAHLIDALSAVSQYQPVAAERLEAERAHDAKRQETLHAEAIVREINRAAQAKAQAQALHKRTTVGETRPRFSRDDDYEQLALPGSGKDW